MDERERLRRRRLKKKRLRQRRIRLLTLGMILILVGIIVLCFSCASHHKKDDESQKVSQEVSSDKKKKQKKEEVYVEPEIEILMVGDILLHDNVQESGKLSDGTYNYDHLFANVAEDIKAADIAIANQEVILGGSEIGLYGYPNFNGPYEVGDALAKAGFDVILHATNHSLDRGKTALVN